MANKKGTLPELLFISPIGHNREKIRHKRVVFKVEECDENGVPRELTLLREDETVDIRGQRFITAYIQAHNLYPNEDAANYKAPT